VKQLLIDSTASPLWRLIIGMSENLMFRIEELIIYYVSLLYKIARNVCENILKIVKPQPLFI